MKKQVIIEWKDESIPAICNDIRTVTFTDKFVHLMNENMDDIFYNLDLIRAFSVINIKTEENTNEWQIKSDDRKAKRVFIGLCETTAFKKGIWEKTTR